MKQALLAVLSALAFALPAGAQSRPQDVNFTLSADALRDNGALAPYENLLRAPALIGLTTAPSGAVFANLRSLGLGNTLVLINGRRAFGFSNLNALPLAALSRVEVMRDGLGAIYGDGAAGGVLNFVTYNAPGEPRFTGTEIDLVYGVGKRGGDFRSASFVTGFANEKVSILVAAGYSSQDRFTVGGITSPKVERRSVYAAFEAPVAGNAARVYGDVLQSNTRVGAGTAYSPLSGGYFDRNAYDVRSTRATVGLRGELGSRGSFLSNISYDVGAVVEQSRFGRD